MASKNATVKNLLIKEYGTCFLGGEVCKQNPYSYHHIFPVRHGGRTTFENGALLCRIEHDIFNAIEREEQNRAREINDYFKYFKQTKDMEALKQMKYYIQYLTNNLGYKVEERGKILILKRA